MPTVTFITPVFHPLVDPNTRQLRLKAFIDRWRPYEHTIARVLSLLQPCFSEGVISGLESDQCADADILNMCGPSTPHVREQSNAQRS